MRKPVRPRKSSITWHPLSWPAGRIPILIADDPNEVYDEDKDNDEVCPTRTSKKLSLKGQP